MPQERMTPDNYMNLHHRTLKHSIEDATNSNLSRAMDAFTNLNPAGAANSLKNQIQPTVNNTTMELDIRQAAIYAFFLIGIGAASSFLGAWLFREYKKRDN